MLCDRLKELREDNDFSQEYVAGKLNIGRSTYANYETGRTEPNILLLLDLANFYNVSIDYLCCNTDIKESYFKNPRLAEYINKCLLIYKEFFDKKRS